MTPGVHKLASASYASIATGHILPGGDWPLSLSRDTHLTQSNSPATYDIINKTYPLVEVEGEEVKRSAAWLLTARPIA
jgi:hypothetical protein